MTIAERSRFGGTDGHRGIAFQPVESPTEIPIDEPTFALATHALIRYQQERGAEGPVVVAWDTRPSSEVLGRAVIDGALERGVEVLKLGLASTPAALKVAQKEGAMSAGVITASHNPRKFNGLKLTIGADKPGSGAIDAFSRGYWDNVDSGLVIPRGAWKDVKERSDLLDWYADAVVVDIEAAYGARPLEGKLIVVDGAYGAAQQLTPYVFRQLGATVETFACDNAGFINDGCGAADLSGLRAFLASRPDITSNPDFIGAVANDGDADRSMGVGVVTRRDGTQEFVEINGNHIMWALAQGEPGIVGTDYTNSGFTRRLAAEGVGFEYCRNGDVNVTRALRAKQAAGQQWTRGGEATGHLVDTAWLSSGDGVRMAAWFSAWAAKRGKTFANIHEELPLWHEKKVGIELDSPRQAAALRAPSPYLQRVIQEEKDRLGDDGRILERISGTEPLYRIWGESIRAGEAAVAVNAIAAAVRKSIASL